MFLISQQIAPDHGANQMIVPEQIQDQCKQEATIIVETYNSKNSRRAVQDTKTIGLVSNLTSLMLQIKVGPFLYSVICYSQASF